MANFAEATSVRRVDDGRYEIAIHPDYVPNLSSAALGAYLLATVVRAVLDASPHPHPVATSAHFLRPGVAGPAEIRLAEVRAGRTVATIRATMTQGGRPILEATVSTARLDARIDPTWTVAPPRLPPIEECVQLDPAHPLGPGRRFMEQFDTRHDPATLGWFNGQPHGVPELRAYFRLREDYEPDPCVLALAVEAKPPVPLGVGVFGPLSTVELTLHMRAVPAPGWLVIHAKGRLISDRWFDEEVDLWDSAGRLVAQSRQLARFASS